LAADLFDNAKLRGSWDASGHYSDQWSEKAMTKVKGPDGCPAFTTEVDLDPADPKQVFYWGVELDGPAGRSLWGIMTEEKSATSAARRRSFRVSDGNQVYYLNHSRRMGAQKHHRKPDEKPGIRFSVWAPNANNVEVCVGALWQRGGDDQQAPLVDRNRTPALISADRPTICGGYITDGPTHESSGLHSDWGPFTMNKDAAGIWSTDPNDMELADFAKFDHLPYMYRVTKDNGHTAFRTDLYSRCQIGFGKTRPTAPFLGFTRDLDGLVSCSVVVDPDRVTKQFLEPRWPETEWLTQTDFFADPAPDPRLSGLNLRDLVIYELHIGALGAKTRAADQPGTLEDAIALLGYLQDLGVNAVELLPLSEFGGGGVAWGYATSHYFAIEYSGGGRDQYKWFIRECHKRGIAVILDVVYNHYNHQAERAEWMYDTDNDEKNAYYWYEGRGDDYSDFNDHVRPDQRGQGGYVDNLSSAWAPRYWEEPVRNMFVSSALALAAEFNVDGLRVDQTTSIRSYNALHADGRGLPEANAFGAKLLRELTRSLRFIKPRVMLMAEDHDNWDGVTRNPDQGGLGFDAVWYADFYHHLIGDTDKGSDYAKLIKTAGLGDDRPLAMDYFAAALQATQGGHKIVYHESHDEAGNGKFTDRTIRVAVNGAPLVGETRRYAEARCRFAAGVTLLSAGVPMFLFGEEVGVERKFLYDHVLENREDLETLRHGSGRNLFEFYRQLIRLRLAHPGFRSPDIDVIFAHNEHRLLAFRRWGGGEEFLVVASLNNRAFDHPSYVFRAERIPGGRWREIFNSDSEAFGGSNIGNFGAEIRTSPGSIECVVPANGFLVFQKTE
jgi:1,4-alpha-glucan branching enzyme